MQKMIRLRYTPTTIRSLQRLLQIHEEGNIIPDDEWEGNSTEDMKAPRPLLTTCNGIQSQTLDKHAPFHLEYCHGLGWFMDLNGNWHTKDCRVENVDAHARCTKCRSAHKHMTHKRHPKLFEAAPMPSLLPNVPDIVSLISKRLECIGESEYDIDPEIAQAAGLLRLNDCDYVDVGNSKLFVACEKCPAHRVCRKQSNVVALCQPCRDKQNFGAVVSPVRGPVRGDDQSKDWPPTNHNTHPSWANPYPGERLGICRITSARMID